MGKPRIRISLVTNIETVEWSFGRQVLEVLCGIDHRLVPENFDNDEKITTAFEGIDACEKFWAPEVIMDAGPYGRTATRWDAMWKRKATVKSRGHMHHTLVNQRGEHKPGRLTIDADSHRKIDWPKLFHQLCKISDPIFGTLHLITDVEASPGAFGLDEAALIAADEFLRGPSGIALEREGLPNLAWATFLGGQYASEIDVVKLHANEYQVEKIGGGCLVTLTSSLFDVADIFPQFSLRRARLKKLLRPDLFRLVDEPHL
ncbi:hypothetical protein ACNRDB_04290 [Ralstonia pseudosolanacearum]|uniref:hypothetical protein n=1 Tax=Ralstonia pseudosolanacearum TaxID=1310165 RepID=UPI0018D1D3F4|nr:hypothetical protein [Ralstonia pseudosolanacearum]